MISTYGRRIANNRRVAERFKEGDMTVLYQILLICFGKTQAAACGYILYYYVGSRRLMKLEKLIR